MNISYIYDVSYYVLMHFHKFLRSQHAFLRLILFKFINLNFQNQKSLILALIY